MKILRALFDCAAFVRTFSMSFFEEAGEWSAPRAVTSEYLNHSEASARAARSI